MILKFQTPPEGRAAQPSCTEGGHTASLWRSQVLYSVTQGPMRFSRTAASPYDACMTLQDEDSAPCSNLEENTDAKVPEGSFTICCTDCIHQPFLELVLAVSRVAHPNVPALVLPLILSCLVHSYVHNGRDASQVTAPDGLGRCKGHYGCAVRVSPPTVPHQCRQASENACK